MKFNVYDYVELRQALNDKMCDIQEKIKILPEGYDYATGIFEMYGYKDALEVIDTFFDRKQLATAKYTLTTERLRVLNKQADMLLSIEQDGSRYE